MPSRQNKKKNSRQKDAPAGRELAQQGPDRTLVYKGVGFPDEYYTDLLYIQTTQITGSATTLTVFQSSCYDPLTALGGGQPTFFDQLSAVYARNQVMKMSVEVEIMTVSATVPINVATAWTDELPTASTPDELAMYRFSRSRLIGTNGGPVVRWREHMDMNRIHGYPDIKQVGTLQGTSVASPSDLAFFTIATQPSDGATGASIVLRTRLRLGCRFFSLVTPSPS